MVYDANGNLTSDGTWTFAYDAQNMLRSSTSAVNTSTYQYDPVGRRQMLTEGGTTTTFLHDGDEEIADYAAAAVLRRYVPGPGTDMPIAMVTPSGGSNTRNYFHTNRQGSTIAMSADDGTVVEGPYTYDAYGNGAPTTGVPFKYTGRRLDAGTGLYYYRARYYSAALGRFLQVDPIGYRDQINLYAYVANAPTSGTDPSGLRFEFDGSQEFIDKFWRDYYEVCKAESSQACTDLKNLRFDKHRHVFRETKGRNHTEPLSAIDPSAGPKDRIRGHDTYSPHFPHILPQKQKPSLTSPRLVPFLFVHNPPTTPYGPPRSYCRSRCPASRDAARQPARADFLRAWRSGGLSRFAGRAGWWR
jgi:RHS repeat-associated protein